MRRRLTANYERSFEALWSKVERAAKRAISEFNSNDDLPDSTLDTSGTDIDTGLVRVRGTNESADKHFQGWVVYEFRDSRGEFVLGHPIKVHLDAYQLLDGKFIINWYLMPKWGEEQSARGDWGRVKRKLKEIEAYLKREAADELVRVYRERSDRYSSTDLKDQLVKLGSSRKDLRPHIRPVLAELEKTAAGGSFVDVIQDHFEKLAYSVEVNTEREAKSEGLVVKRSKITKSIAHFTIAADNDVRSGGVNYTLSIGPGRKGTYVATHLRRQSSGRSGQITERSGDVDVSKAGKDFATFMIRDARDILDEWS